MKEKTRLYEIITDKKVIWFICGWISAFIIAGIGYLAIHTQAFVGHFDAWLQTIGALLGSFSGAALAGWCALTTVRYQLNKEQQKENKRQKEENLKILDSFTYRIRTIMKVYNDYLKDTPREILEDDDGKSFAVHDMDSLTQLGELVDKYILELMSVNIANAEYNVYSDIILAKACLYFCSEAIKRLINFYNNGTEMDEENYEFVRDECDEAFDSLETALEELIKHQ